MQGHRMHRLSPTMRKPLYLIIGALLFLTLVPFMFGLGIITGVGFLLSCCLALYRGLLWRDGRTVIFIALGYALTSYAFHFLLPFALDGWRQRSVLTVALVCLAFLAIWLRSRRLKQGRR